ncbi:MAG: glycosyltransferase [Lachnospiraceae bacterium]|nr:glycosyltransferase [Lachnospiraceae bacterium]
MEHTFAICAYKESEYLQECIESLLAQSVRSNIFIATHTDNRFIRQMAERYDLKVYINEGETGITQDWNFALSKVETPYATIAHQDDVYEPTYTEEVLDRMHAARHPLLCFTDYFEIREGKRITDSTMIRIKRMLLFPLRNRAFDRSIFMRRRCLSLGDPVICPSLTFALHNLNQPLFQNHMLASEDWEMLEVVSRQKGDFMYIPKMLTGHRIHEESTTTEALQGGRRARENLEVLEHFWPKPIARFINHFYNKSEKYNKVENI